MVNESQSPSLENNGEEKLPEGRVRVQEVKEDRKSKKNNLSHLNIQIRVPEKTESNKKEKIIKRRHQEIFPELFSICSDWKHTASSYTMNEHQWQREDLKSFYTGNQNEFI